MATKPTLTPLDGSGNLSSVVFELNNNLDVLAEAIEDCVSRVGSAPNALGANLDVNNFRVLNVPYAISNTEPVPYAQAVAMLSGSIPSVTWASLTGTPTTIAGYGITDAYTKTYIDSLQSTLNSSISGKQATLVSGTNIKTINSTSLLGSGDIVIGGGGAGTTVNAVTFNNAGSGAASGTTFDGSAARTISYNTIGAAPLASPTFTGTPSIPTGATAVTQSVGNNTTALATTAFVNAEIANDAVVLTGNQTVLGNKTFSGITALATDSTINGAVIGTRDVPVTISNANKTFALVDAAKAFGKDNGTGYTYTIPANASVAFPIGTAITIFNNNAASNIALAITTDTLRLAGTATTGTLQVAPFGHCTIHKVASTVWMAMGAGVSA